MASAQGRMRIVIDAKNQASGELERVKRDVKELDSVAGAAAGGLGGYAAMAGVAGIALLGQQVAGAVIEMGKLGAAAQEMRGALDDVAQGAGMSGDAILRALRTASEGMVTDADLMVAANKAIMMGAADNLGELTGLMEVAKVRSDAMGMSVSEAYMALAESIGKVSERGLYALGIQLDMEKVNAAYARSIGTTASALSEAQKQQAMYNAVVADSAALVAAGGGLSAADKIDQAATAWTNLKMAIGEALAPAVVMAAEALTAALNEMAGTSERAVEIKAIADLGEIRTAIAALESMRGAMRNVVGGDLSAMTTESRARYEELGREIDAANAELRDEIGLVDRLAGAWPAAGAGMAQAKGNVDALTQALVAQASAANEAIWATNKAQGQSIEGSLIGMAGDLGVERALALNDQLNAALDERTRKMMQAGATEDEIKFRNAAWEDEQIGRLRTEIGEREKLDRAVSSNASSVSALSSEYNDLKGKVEGVLSSSLGDMGGVNPEDFLPREDAVAENARRLGDIMVNGLKGQEWLDEFKAEVPDAWALIASSSDPKGMAASLLKDFQDGLRPDLLDKEKAKELIRTAILGEQSMAALASEISGELAAEMGISLEQARAAAVGVLGGGAGADGEGGGGGQIALGMDGKGEGEAFMDALTGAIKTRQAQIFASGQEVGGQWGAGFMSVVETGVPPSLIGLLATLVTPAVMAAWATQQGQTGARP